MDSERRNCSRQSLIAALVDGVIYLITKNIAIAVVFILTAIAGSVMMLTKDKTNISVVDQIGFMIKFFRSQKKYKYKYLDEWK